jgi:hypothetical protein
MIAISLTVIITLVAIVAGCFAFGFLTGSFTNRH